MGHSKLSVVAPGEVETYYRSIEVPFWVAWRAISRRDDPTGIVLIGFLLCFVPMIPFLASTFLRIIYGNPTVHVWVLRIEPSSFWLWWPVSAIGSFLFLILMGRQQGRLAEYRIHLLSPQQLRFAYCYGALDEIRRYRSNQMHQHIRTAERYLRQLVIAMIRASTLDLAEGAYPYHYWQSDAWVGKRKSGEDPSVGIRLKLPSWYKLQPETEEIIKAFPRVVLLKERIAGAHDLDVVESALTDLGTFLYTEIPNVPGAPPRSALEKVGADSLLSFAKKVNALAPYIHQPQEPKPRRSLRKALGTLGQRFMAIFTHENVLAVFFAWYSLMLVLEIAVFSVVFRLVPKLTVDTTLLATAIGTPFAVAAAALVVSKRPTSSQD